METTTMGELFTEEQIRQAAKILRHPPFFTPLTAELVQMLKNTGFNRPDVDMRYAAYLLEWQRDAILKAFSK